MRDLESPKHGFALRGPANYLKTGEGHNLKTRVRLKELLKANPINRCGGVDAPCPTMQRNFEPALTSLRDPPFRKGTGGVRLSFESVPVASSIFRHLRDNGTIDFVAMRWTNTGNECVWARKGTKPGVSRWGVRPSEVDLTRWLPIFLEGIREYQEPYRFLAIMGSQALIEEAGQMEGGGGLRQMAADLVPPLKKALDTREPTVVMVAVELMKAVLTIDPLVRILLLIIVVISNAESL